MGWNSKHVSKGNRSDMVHRRGCDGANRYCATKDAADEL